MWRSKPVGFGVAEEAVLPPGTRPAAIPCVFRGLRSSHPARRSRRLHRNGALGISSAFYRGPLHPGEIDRFIGVLGTFGVAGCFGVDLFFALSGYLITTLLLKERGDARGYRPSIVF